MNESFPFVTISLLGVVTIAAYGTWYYAFGVLLDPLLADTGWPERWVTGAFALSAAGGGLAAPLAGRLLDRFRSRRLFIAAALISTLGLGGASFATSLAVFVVCAVIGGASLTAFGFYHITQTTAVRAAPATPSKAIAVLTIYGAFASTIYLPLAAWLVSSTDWRVTLRILVAGTAVVLLLAAALVREVELDVVARSRVTLRASLKRPDVRRYAMATAGVGVASGIILVYQVPLMTDAGLPLTTAAALAGARGAAQIGGRIPMHLMVNRFGARGSLQIAFAAVAAGILLLAGSGSMPLAIAFVLVAGFGIGATSPLQGVYASELFEPDRLGESMGTIGMVFGLSGALGPASVGILADLTGTRWWAVAIGAAAATIATLLMAQPRTGPPRTEPPRTELGGA